MYDRLRAHVAVILALALVLPARPARAFQIYAVAEPGSLNSGTTTFYPLAVHDQLTSPSGVSTTREAAEVAVPGGTFHNLACVLGAAPGGGKSWTITLQVNDNDGDLTDDDTALTFTINDPNRSAFVAPATPVSVSSGDMVNLKVVPSGTPAATSLHCTLLFE